MSKISISKKTAWSLILKINTKVSCKNNLVNISEDIRGIEISVILIELSGLPIFMIALSSFLFILLIL